jgi:hypothetical protein
MRRSDTSPGISASIERLRQEHAEIADRHTELREQIGILANGGYPNPEMFGYLLRSVFEFRCRHIDAEAELEALLPRLLAPADTKMLISWQATRPTPHFPVNLLRPRRG